MLKRSSVPSRQSDSNRVAQRAPTRDIFRMQRTIDRMFDDLLGSPVDFAPVWSELEEAAMPVADIEETDSHFLVSFDMPGMRKEDIRIEVRDNQLVVHAERRQEKAEGSRIASERYYGVFERIFALPTQIDPDKIEARYQDGVLMVAVPRKEESKSKVIELKEGKSGIFDRLLGRQSAALSKSEKAA